ncbi:hypothetical protein [Sorangium sp. So ce1000]|uniref:hypothetical protein n=1 Tax=Sorangium sp. So ce1000 TaxID=3133325 RepID=UPI003F64056F
MASAVVSPFMGCVYDGDQPCGPGQTLKADSEYFESCVCAAGYAATKTGCVRCGENEDVGASGCVCKAGYGRADATSPCAACGENEVTGATGACECAAGFSRASAEAPCTATPAGLNAACDTATMPCSDATYNHCHALSGTTGYCTRQGCSGAADCADGYMCDLTVAPSYCRRPPVGAGKTCASDADCAGTEATYCNIYETQKCQVQGCTLSPNNCFTGTVCCDLTDSGVAQYQCVAEGSCTN